MADKVYTDNRIDPQQWYSDGDLKTILDIQYDAQRKARDAGQLKYTQRGTTFLYRGQAVLDWLENDQADASQAKPTGRRAGQGRSLGRSVTTTNSRSASRSPATTPTQQRTRTPMNSDHQTIDRWNAAVREQTAAGKTKAQAVRAVVRQNPQLHRAYLIACNRGRPAAVRALQDT